MKSIRFLFGSQRALDHACMHILDFLRGMTARIDGRKGIGFGLVYVVHPIFISHVGYDKSTGIQKDCRIQ